MKTTSHSGKVLLSLSILTALAFSFQNCAGKNFETAPVVDVECNNAEGCTSAASTSGEAEQTPAPAAATVSTVQTGSGFVVGPSTSTNNHTFLNFVAGDKYACEASVADRLGMHVTCTIGGGCGNCGIPSATCASANPSLYGACILH